MTDYLFIKQVELKLSISNTINKRIELRMRVSNMINKRIDTNITRQHELLQVDSIFNIK